jgi:hypothetical protein
MMKRYLILVIFLFSSLLGFAQISLLDSTETRPYAFTAGINYLSNYVYNGRSDSLKAPYFIPSLTFRHENGLSLSADLYILNNGVSNGFDFLELNGSYNFNIYKNLSGGINGTKYIINESSESFFGSISYILGGFLNQDFGFCELNVGVDALVGSGKTDIRLSPGIERTWEWGTEDKRFQISPSLYAIYSTLNYFEGFTEIKNTNARSRQKGRGLASVNQPVIISNTVVRNPGLTFMTYEIAVPFTFETKKMGISFIPTFAMPKNPIYTDETTTVTFPNKTSKITTIDDTYYSELHLSNVFYGQLNLYLKF